MKLLRRAQLQPIHHVKGPADSVKGIDVFEIRVRGEVGEDEDTDVLIRIYHAEPTRLHRPGGSVIVGLHMHVKDVSDPTKVRER